MNKFIILAFFLFVSCGSSPTKNKLDFSDISNFDKFMLKLENYAKNSPYPNIDD
ncbi:hypothetical protein IDH20_00945 [Pelagibacterales bacterium SAG-MED39]|nr:hypothetical protein [Pelagibacterales bacterium SAG-MED39]